MACTKSAILAQAKSWIGKTEKDGSFMEIIDVYNSHKPLARGYRMKYTDAWCATFISALAIKNKATDIIPTECGCEKQIELFKALGSWIEDESITPEVGDIIYYDWQDSGKGDNKGFSDHVGLVSDVKNGLITVIEGNYSNSVKCRSIAVNSRYIRGYARPKYEAEKVKEVKVDPVKVEVTPNYYVVLQGDTLSKIARQFSTTVAELVKLNNIENPNRIYAGQKLIIKASSEAPKATLYKVKTSGGELRIRRGAGTDYAVLGTFANGFIISVSEVKNGWAKLADREGYVSAAYITKY